MDTSGLEPPTNNDYKLTHGKTIQPLSGSTANDPNLAVELIRKKLDSLFTGEPDAEEEKTEVEHLRNRSTHQEFMYQLSHSGKSLAQIQTEWHNYYVGLPDAEKRQVWQEFYSAHKHPTETAPKPASTPKHEPHHQSKTPDRKHAFVVETAPEPDQRTVAEVKEQLVKKVRTRSKPKHGNLHSLLFGLSTGGLMILILLFGFFNERFIAPFITPSKTVSSTLLIIDPGSTAVDAQPKIVIPKINVEIPVVYDEPSVEESAVQVALERGVVHYANTPNPGELGNGVIFGHSSNNLLNKGKYKFAFALLHRAEIGDTFYLQKDGKRYIYKIFEKKIVPPTDVSVLNAGDKPATFTLITCDPPGTNLNRLVLVGEQISPDPGANLVAKQTTPLTPPVELPGNAPSLWSRMRSWFSS